MSIQVRGNGGTVAETEANTRAQRVTIKPPNLDSNGAYRVCTASGLITTVAAATATAGHIFAARWGHASKLCLVTNFKATWVTIAGFTAAQEVGMDLIVARSYSASHSGGTALTLTTNNAKKRASHATSQFTDMRIGSTGALTAGTHTLDAQSITQNAFSELAAAATVPKGFFTMQFAPSDPYDHPLILSNNEGLILRNSILMGAGGTARVFVEMDWIELDTWI